MARNTTGRFPRFLVLFGLVFLAGCESEPGPREVLRSYLKATTQGDLDGAYGYISSGDQAARSLAAYKGHDVFGALAQLVAGMTSYEIIDVHEDGNTATAEVEFASPNFSGLAGDFFGTVLAAALDQENQEKIQKQLADKIREADVPITTRREEFQLVREVTGWRVFLDWEKEVGVAALLKEGNTLRATDLYAAREAFGQLLELQSDHVESRKNLDEVLEEIQILEEKQEYLDRIQLYDLEARYRDSRSEKNIPGVTFKLKNTGDRTLNKVEVTVYFKDAEGTIIAEEDYHPVLVTEFSFGDKSPLRPSYIWQMERGKFYAAKSVPTEWKAGAVSAKVTDIEFADERP